MLPKKSAHVTRVVFSALASIALLIALFLPAVNFAAGQLLTSITVAPELPTLEPGQTQQFTAVGTYSDGTTRPLTGGGGTWAATGSLATARYYHTATLLQDGSVLVVGGVSGSPTFATAQRYSPSTHTWSPAGTMSVPRAAHTATLLPNGKVLVVGGMDFSTDAVHSSTELYDPATNSWSNGATLSLGVRAFHSAVLLDTGKVLVVAGVRAWPDCTYRTNAELYNPADNTWAATGSLHLARSNASTVLLTSGQVLLAAGPANNCPTPNVGMSQAETYNPATGLWTVTTGSLNPSRYNNFIAALPNGNALIAGGVANNILPSYLAKTDVYDAGSRTFSASGSMSTARVASGGTGDNGTTVVLENGAVLVAGGHNTSGSLSSAELYNSTTGSWTTTGSMATARTLNTATLLKDGTVLVVGGQAVGGLPLASAELYTPQVSWSSSNPAVATVNQTTGLVTAVGTGTTNIKVSSGNISGFTTLTVEQDMIPPSTIANYASPNVNGWHRSDVTVNLTTTDSGGSASSSGVQSLTYSLSGAHSGGGTGFVSADGSLATATLTIMNEGTTFVTYHAVDNEGNVEPDVTITINLDKTPPALSGLSNITTSATSTQGAVVTFSPTTSDATSGVNSVAVTQGLASGSIFPHGTTAEQVTVTDNADNSTSQTFSVTVNKTLTAVGVTPSPVTLSSGQHQQFTAMGTYSDGSTQQLLSSGGGGGGGGGGGNFGPNPLAWQVQFPQLSDFSACATPQYPLTNGGGAWTSQNLLTQNGGSIDMMWSAGTPVVHVQGTVTLNDVVLTLACTNGAASGTINAVWTGTRYAGQMSFDNRVTPVTITGWSSKPAMPTARFGLTAAALGGQVYAIGGVGDGFGPSTLVEVYDPATGSWSNGPGLNVGREGGRAVTLGNRMYVIGGHVPGGLVSNFVEVLDPSLGNTWTVLASDPMPTARANFALVTDGAYLYAIGGDTAPNNGGQIATVERFDPSAPQGLRWAALTPMPVAGNAIGAGVIGNTIVVAGAGGTSRTDIYNIGSDTWSSGVPMPAQRSIMASAVPNGGLWLVGGTTNGSLNYDTWVYYPQTPNRAEGWGGVGSMLTGRSMLAAAVIGDVIYALGGSDAATLALATNESLSVPPFEDLATSGGNNNGGANSVNWSSTNPAVATIDPGGSATAGSIGETTIVATSGNISCQTTSSCATLTVSNSVPAVQIFSGQASANESNFQNFSTGGNFTDPDQQQWTATVDYGDGTGVQPLNLFNLQSGFTPTGQFSLAHTYRDNGVFTVTVTVSDGAGGVGTATRTMTINNVAPQVFGPQSSSTNTGNAQTFGCASFFDVAGDAPFTATVNYGDGSGDQPIIPNVPGSCGGGGTPAGAINLSHVYATGGNFIVTVKVTDKDLATGMTSFPITVNAPPSVTINGTPLAAINEGGTFNGSVSFTDAAGDGPWTIRVTYGDNTGQLTVNPSPISPGSYSLPSHVYKDNGTYTITVQVTDRFFLTGTTTTTLVVNNVAPSVNNLPALGPITEGGPSVNFSVGYSDPGLNDNFSPGFKAQINWGDGSAIQNVSNLPFNSSSGTGSFFLNHNYVDNPAAPNTAFTITVTVTDKDGAVSTSKTTAITVNNAAPTLQLNNFQELVDGAPATFSGQLFDQGAADAPWTGTANFGDGSPVQPITFVLNAPGSQGPRATFTLTHTYHWADVASSNGNVVLTLTATDKDGVTGTRTFNFHVDPAILSVSISPGGPVWLNAVGQTKLFKVVAHLSDGTTASPEGEVDEGVMWSSSNTNVATIAQNGLATAVGPGVTTISVLAQDDLGHTFTAQAMLTVDVAAPVITANDITAEATGNASANVLLVFSATDNLDPAPTVSADHGSGVYPLGTTPVVVTATDAAGNVSTKTIHVDVIDTTPPSIAAPANVTVDATGPSGAFVNPGTATATDSGGPVVVSGGGASGQYPIGTTTLTWIATDQSGNTASAVQHIIVIDTAPPTLSLPANITTDATSPSGAVVIYSATATDSSGGTLAVACVPPSGGMFPIGTTTVTCVAMDAAGNSASGSFTVLVQAAAAQVTNLILTVEGFNLAQGIDNSLDTKLQNVLAALNAAQGGNATSACGQLGAFINETSAQSGKKLTVAQANTLIAAAQQIRAVIGCQ